MNKGSILIADDERVLTNSLARVLTDAGYTVTVCNNGADVIRTVAETTPDIILLDNYLGEYNGIRLLKQMRSEGWEMPVVMMTAHADIAIAVEAMKVGAIDFLPKPFNLDHLVVLTEKLMEHVRLRSKVKALQEELNEQRSRSGIIGSSPELQRTLKIAQRLARGESTTVLLEGESGTGKEMFARFIHEHSARRDQPFITINCGAIPKDLAESEFFGYEKGAFTGATEKMKQGRFELANGGTILLDEIAELSLDMQVKLLRVLEERKFYRLGGTKEVEVDVRVIAASNRDLQKEVEAGRFREDLYYRLNVALIRVPPLRQRTQDIRPLAYAFLQEFCTRLGKPVPVLAPETEEFLTRLPWKGNVRELRNAVERVGLLSDAGVLTPEDFSFLTSGRNRGAGMEGLDGDEFVLRIPRNGIPMKVVLRELILKTLAITNGNQVQAAKVLGITRSKLRYRMDQLAIEPQERTYRVTA